MQSEAKKLEALGHEVQFPPMTEPDENGNPIPTSEYYQLKKDFAHDKTHWIWKHHDNPIRDHFIKVEWSDAILVLNLDKNGIKGYVGPNTLMEMGLSFYLNKPIYLYNDIPEVAWKEEILGMKPIVIHQDYSLIK